MVGELHVEVELELSMTAAIPVVMPLTCSFDEQRFALVGSVGQGQPEQGLNRLRRALTLTCQSPETSSSSR